MMPLSTITIVTPVPSAPHGWYVGASPSGCVIRRSPHGAGLLGLFGTPLPASVGMDSISGSTRATSGWLRSCSACAAVIEAAKPTTAYW